MKMDITCQSCDKKYKIRSSYEKHRTLCTGKQPKINMKKMIIALTKRVEQLEKQLGVQDFSEPTITFQEFLKTDYKMQVDWEAKALDIYSSIVMQLVGCTTCMKMCECIYVYEGSWICLRDSENIGVMICSIKTKLINILIQKEDFKNMAKITNIDTKNIVKMIKHL